MTLADSRFFKEQAQRCRALAVDAVKWTVRQGLLDMASDFERLAADMEDTSSPASRIPTAQ
jgi:hypothetical protein